MEPLQNSRAARAHYQWTIHLLIALDSTVIFHSELNLIIQMSSKHMYVLNLKYRKWTWSNGIPISSVIILGRKYLAYAKTAVYIDSSVFVFSPTFVQGGGFVMRVWKLRNNGIRWVLWLVDEQPRQQISFTVPFGVWNRIGDDLIFLQPDFINEGYWHAVGNTRTAVGQKYYESLSIWTGFLLYDKFLVLTRIANGRRTIPNLVHLSWYMDLRTATWSTYLTNMSVTAMQTTAASANWNDKSLVVYGGLSEANQLFDDQGGFMNFYTSDVWVYYLRRRQWFKVKTTGKRPVGRVYSTFIYVPPNSFLLCGGASMRLQGSDFVGRVSNSNFKFNISNVLDVAELHKTLEIRNDVWRLTLSDCEEDCYLRGVTGHWTQMKSKKSSRKPGGLMGHSSVFLGDQMFLFGGYKRLTVNQAESVLCSDDIWSYDIHNKNWKWIEVSTGRVEMSTSPLRSCKVPATVLQSRLVVSTTQRNDTSKERLHSYLKDLARWVDHNISLPSEVDIFFTWHDRVIALTHSNREPFLSNNSPINRYRFSYSWHLAASSLKLGCQRGQFSSNWSTEICSPCQIGHYSPQPQATSCTKCPTGLTTKFIGAISISNCSCDPHYCQYGECLVISREDLKGAVCKCNIGYTGERCGFPILLISTFTSTAAFAIILIMARLVQKIKEYKDQKRADNVQLEDMNRAWTINCSEIQLMHRLDLQSPGSYGDVYQAKYRDFTVAVKKLKIELRNDVRVEREFEREIQVMKSIRHQNIVLFIGAGKFGGEDDCPFLVLEFMPRGTLSSLLRDRDVEYDLCQQISFCLDTARGMEFLHNLSPPRIHRDIKSNNLLLSEQLVVKVSDFGSARLVKGRESMQRVQRTRGTPFQLAEDATTPLLNPNSDLSRNVGAVLWRATEVFSARSYGTAIDVYRCQQFGIR